MNFLPQISDKNTGKIVFQLENEKQTNTTNPNFFCDKRVMKTTTAIDK